jgi:predicted membrane protein
LLLFLMVSCLFRLITEQNRPAVLYSWSAFIFGYKHFSVKVNDSFILIDTGFFIMNSSAYTYRLSEEVARLNTPVPTLL